MPTSTRLSDTCLSVGLAFVGGYGDAASFVLAKTFTGHVTGATAVAAQDWRTVLGHLTAIVTFLLGVLLSIVIVRPLRVRPSWPLLPTILGIEAILMVTAALITLRYLPQSHVIPQAPGCNRERCIAAPSSGAMSQSRQLINAGCSFPIENVNQLPRVPNEIYLQLPLLIDLELGCGVEHARALALVRVVQI